VRTLPVTMIRALSPFAPLFSKRVFQHVQVLMAGAFPQLLDVEPLALPCVRWAWTNTSASIATTECLAALTARVGRWVAS
jgi:hypothetical protein